jgi:uncharacterized protein (TIGR02246 family)
MVRELCAAGAILICLTACTPKANQMSSGDLTEFATRYAAAWSGKDPDKFAAFYDENGSLTVNGASSVGRTAITATARAYMAAFPDMVVKLDSLRQEKGQAVFHWTWTGTNTGPGGTGRAVNLRGYERWTIGANRLIARSDGHFDNDEYQRQLNGSSSSSQ